MARKRAQESQLATYRAKRDFSRTSEPATGGAGAGLFVVQHHWARRDHYDFRLEIGGVLASWAVTRGPSADPADKRLAVRTEDHPLAYADFEGMIPRGAYGGGSVLIFDQGHWAPISADPPAALREGHLKFELFGERMKGRWALVRLREKGPRENWLLIKERDGFVQSPSRLLEADQTSVASGRDRAGVEHNLPAAKMPDTYQPPHFVAPMLCTRVELPPSGDEWLHEIKYDGYRIQIAADGSDVRIYTRIGQDWRHRFAGLALAVARRNFDRVLIDGEAVVFDERGLSDFIALVDALDSVSGPIVFVAFDLLNAGGVDWRHKPLIERKDALAECLSSPDPFLRLAPYQIGRGEEVFAHAAEGGAEGVVSKRCVSTYRSGRSKSWLKIKHDKREDFVVVGYVPSDRRPFASLLLAAEDKGALRYVGAVGTGFSDAFLRRTKAELDADRSPKPPPELARADLAPRKAVWVAPRRRAELVFAARTADGLLRHARFLRFREDVPVMQSVSKPKLAPARLTHAERILFPACGITKGDLHDYYQRVADRIMPHLEGRPVSFVRAPDGLEAETFFQRHLLPGMKRGVSGVPDPIKKRNYLKIDDAEGLDTAAQFSVIELHGWGARLPNLEAPDRLVFDLDPDPALAFDEVKKAALELRDILAQVDLRSFALASGGKGLHVVVPLDASQDWETIETFASGFARGLARAAPGRYVAVMSKARREGRIFIDWLRNQRTATAILPWSPRARPTASVAMPLSWAELPKLRAPDAFTLKDAPDRRDPWQGFFGVKQRIERAMLGVLG